MFLKLFKYDIKAIFFKFLPMILVMFILAILARITVSLNLLDMITLTINSFFIFGCFGAILYVIILCVMRYVQSLFKVQGYLTHTLPVSKNKLLLSQLLADFIMAVLATALVFLCLLIAYLDRNLIEDVKSVLNAIFGNIAIELGGGTIVLMVISIIFSAVQWMFILYLGIALGHIPPKNRTAFSILFCIALSYAINFLTSLLMSLVDQLYANANAVSVQGAVQAVFGTILGSSIVVSIVCYCLIVFIMKKHLNLE